MTRLVRAVVGQLPVLLALYGAFFALQGVRALLGVLRTFRMLYDTLRGESQEVPFAQTISDRDLAGLVGDVDFGPTVIDIEVSGVVRRLVTDTPIVDVDVELTGDPEVVHAVLAGQRVARLGLSDEQCAVVRDARARGLPLECWIDLARSDDGVSTTQVTFCGVLEDEDDDEDDGPV